MGLNILLVNPNQFQKPPVIPIGLEYLLSALRNSGHNAKIIDLCFSDSPINDLEKALNEQKPDIVGFTIRNIDSAIYFNNEFFLPEFKPLIQYVKERNIPVVLGGSGFSAMPREILEFLEADYGVIGPGEIAFLDLLKILDVKKPLERFYNGYDAGIEKELTHERGSDVKYAQYLREEGIIGFETHVGCNSSCPYCIEADRRLSFREIAPILNEIEYLINQGYNHFHTCDTEFNTNLHFSIDFCNELIKKDLDMKWALYMKPTPYNEDLFKVLNESNAYLITLTVDSYEKIQKMNNYTYDDLVKIIEYTKKYHIKLAIDLLVGYPYESLESVKKVIDFFKENRPNSVGISFYYRIYNHTELAELVKYDTNLHDNLIMPDSGDESFLEPSFYTHLSKTIIEKLIENDDLFKIAGITPGVNYQLT